MHDTLIQLFISLMLAHPNPSIQIYGTQLISRYNNPQTKENAVREVLSIFINAYANKDRLDSRWYTGDTIDILNAHHWQNSSSPIKKNQFLIYPVLPWYGLKFLLESGNIAKVNELFDIEKLYSPTDKPDFLEWQTYRHLIFPINVAENIEFNPSKLAEWNHYALIVLSKSQNDFAAYNLCYQDSLGPNSTYFSLEEVSETKLSFGKLAHTFALFLTAFGKYPMILPHVSTHQQVNSYDCGVWVVENIRHLLNDWSQHPPYMWPLRPNNAAYAQELREIHNNLISFHKQEQDAMSRSSFVTPMSAAENAATSLSKSLTTVRRAWDATLAQPLPRSVSEEEKFVQNVQILTASNNLIESENAIKYLEIATNNNPHAVAMHTEELLRLLNSSNSIAIGGVCRILIGLIFKRESISEPVYSSKILPIIYPLITSLVSLLAVSPTDIVNQTQTLVPLENLIGSSVISIELKNLMLTSVMLSKLELVISSNYINYTAQIIITLKILKMFTSKKNNNQNHAIELIYPRRELRTRLNTLCHSSNGEIRKWAQSIMKNLSKKSCVIS